MTVGAVRSSRHWALSGAGRGPGHSTSRAPCYLVPQGTLVSVLGVGVVNLDGNLTSESAWKRAACASEQTAKLFHHQKSQKAPAGRQGWGRGHASRRALGPPQTVAPTRRHQLVHRQGLCLSLPWRCVRRTPAFPGSLGCHRYLQQPPMQSHGWLLERHAGLQRPAQGPGQPIRTENRPTCS